MKLYKISQSKNSDWYSYDSAVVVAENKEAARLIIPSPFYFYDDGFYYKFKNQEPKPEDTDPSWCHPRFVKAEELGDTIRKAGEVVTASYKWGFDESRYLDMRHLGGIARVTATEYNGDVMDAISKLELQLHDKGLAELRYHLIEANRSHNLKKTLEYELKIRDYMNEEYEDWS